MQKPIVYLITEGNLATANFKSESAKTLNKIERAVTAGISMIQIREKLLPANYLLELAVSAVALTNNTETVLLINERFDIALACGADGVHLTSTALPTEVIKKKVCDSLIIGKSTHTLAKARRAQQAGADFVTYSPIFATASKSAGTQEVKGLEKLKNVCEALKPFPVLALGGIGQGNKNSVIDAGASGFAGISYFNFLDRY